MFTDIRVVRQSTDDDHLIGMNFLSADDMDARMAVQLRKRLGFGITANMHITGMHVEGKDRMLDVAFGQTLVEPNMLVIDLEKFASESTGLADPYVKGHLGPYRFQTKIHKKTLNPKWLEEFKIPITSWESLNVPNDEEEQGGTPKMGKASTPRSSFSSRTNNESESSGEFRKMSDEFEPVDIEGSEKPDVWVHRPGSDVTSTWEPRKGRPRCQDSKIQRENDACSDSPRSSVSESHRSDSSTEEPTSGKSHRHLHKVKKGLGKLAGAVFHRSPKKETDDEASPCVTPHINIQPAGESRVSVKYVVDQDPESNTNGTRTDEQQHSSPEREELNSPTKRHLRKKAAHMVKHAGKTAHNLKSMFSKKGFDKSKEECQSDEEGDVVAMKIDGVGVNPPVPSNNAVDPPESVADSKDKVQ
nr:unnamed protein product [Digitaria exilis]